MSRRGRGRGKGKKRGRREGGKRRGRRKDRLRGHLPMLLLTVLHAAFFLILTGPAGPTGSPLCSQKFLTDLFHLNSCMHCSWGTVVFSQSKSTLSLSLSIRSSSETLSDWGPWAEGLGNPAIPFVKLIESTVLL